MNAEIKVERNRHQNPFIWNRNCIGMQIIKRVNTGSIGFNLLKFMNRKSLFENHPGDVGVVFFIVLH